MRKDYRKPLRLATRLSLALSLCGVMLCGCASQPPTQASASQICPEPTPLPATVMQSASPDAKAFSAKASDYSARVRTWLQKERDYLSE